MNKKQTNIDCMKYRKSTHLAGVDVDAIVHEKGKCILTIKEAYYNEGVNVSGNKTDGYFLEFLEDVKPMVINSTNRQIVSKIIKQKLGCTAAESRNISNWKNQQIELYFDENVKMMGKITGGIKVKLLDPTPKIDDSKALELLSSSKTLEDLKKNYLKLTKEERKLPTVNSLKEQLKDKLK